LCFGYCKFTKNTVPVSIKPFIECIPNFSEGRNEKVIDSIVQAMDSIKNAGVLHVDIGYDANRTVITVGGTPEAVFHSAGAGIREAIKHIDMGQQQGEHPRLGAVDVCPFVALQGIRPSELVRAVDEFADQLAADCNIPIYMYGDSARKPDRSALSAIRKGEYEGLPDKLKRTDGLPDLGPHGFNRRFGALTMGVRDLMIAYNIHLDTEDVSIAKSIAADLRESGRMVQMDGGKKRKPGRFSKLKAIGWSMASYGWSQVSMNVMDYEAAPLHEIYELTRKRAEFYGVSVQGSELIGMAPLKAMQQTGRFYAEKAGAYGELEDEKWMSFAVQGLGLDRLGPIRLEDRIIEYVAEKKGFLIV